MFSPHNSYLQISYISTDWNTAKFVCNFKYLQRGNYVVKGHLKSQNRNDLRVKPIRFLSVCLEILSLNVIWWRVLKAKSCCAVTKHFPENSFFKKDKRKNTRWKVKTTPLRLIKRKRGKKKRTFRVCWKQVFTWTGGWQDNCPLEFSKKKSSLDTHFPSSLVEYYLWFHPCIVLRK